MCANSFGEARTGLAAKEKWRKRYENSLQEEEFKQRYPTLLHARLYTMIVLTFVAVVTDKVPRHLHLARNAIS